MPIINPSDLENELLYRDLEQVVPDSEDDSHLTANRKAKPSMRSKAPFRTAIKKTPHSKASILKNRPASLLKLRDRNHTPQEASKVRGISPQNELAERLQAGNIYATVLTLHSRAIKSRLATRQIIADSFQIARHLRDNPPDFVEFISAANWGKTGKLTPVVGEKNQPLIGVLRQVHGCSSRRDLQCANKSVTTLQPFYESDMTAEEFAKKIISGGMDGLRRELKAARNAEAACVPIKIVICRKLRLRCNQAKERGHDVRFINIKLDRSQLDAKNLLLVREARQIRKPQIGKRRRPMGKKVLRPVKP